MGHKEVILSSSLDTGAVLKNKLLTPDSCSITPLQDEPTYDQPVTSTHKYK